MVKTQIQLPDELYRELKRVAREREMSLAEVLRRGAEILLRRYPESPESAETWALPEPRALHGDAFFANPDWRFEANGPAFAGTFPTGEPAFAGEARPVYRAGRKKAKA
jgi:hypothetical protein